MPSGLVSLFLFLRAVEARSLSKAAEQFHLALAAASRRIARLEHCYGVQLLYRSAHDVEQLPFASNFSYTGPAATGVAWPVVTKIHNGGSA